jgi:RecG-like helicase
MTPQTSQLIVQGERVAGLCAGANDQRCDAHSEVTDTDDDIVVGTHCVLQRVDFGERDRVVIDAIEDAAA